MFLNGDNIISASKHTAVSALLYTNHMVTSVTLERAKSIVEQEICSSKFWDNTKLCFN